jgi:hypothetical protein
MTGARGEYPRPDMRKAPGAMAPGPDLRPLSQREVEAATPGGEARHGDAMFWDRVAQSHRRLGRRR